MLTLVFCNVVFRIPVNYFSQYIIHIAALVTLCAGINHLSILIGGCWLHRTWNVCIWWILFDAVPWCARKNVLYVWQWWFCCCSLLGSSIIFTYMSDACAHLPNLKHYSISSTLFCSTHSIKRVCVVDRLPKKKSSRELSTTCACLV